MWRIEFWPKLYDMDPKSNEMGYNWILVFVVSFLKYSWISPFLVKWTLVMNFKCNFQVIDKIAKFEVYLYSCTVVMYLMNYLLIIERKCRTQWIDALQKALKASSTFTKFSIWIATPLKNHDEISSPFRLRDSNLLFEVSYDAQMRCHAWSRPGQSQNLCHCRRGRRHHHYMLHLFMTSCNIKKGQEGLMIFRIFCLLPHAHVFLRPLHTC